jgi:serine/threonine-protein kinase
VLSILAWLHSLGPRVVHRDVKPSNLILRSDGTLALVDLGIAREVSPRGTHRATAAGTFGYMPPEALGGTLDHTADLYGLGATLIHLLSRRPPEELLFAANVDLAAHLNASAAFVAWLSQMTHQRRGPDRFQSAAEALRALERPPTPSTAALPASPLPDPSRQRGRDRSPKRISARSPRSTRSIINSPGA